METMVMEQRLAETHLEAIHRIYTPKQAEFIERVLGEGDLVIIDGTEIDLKHNHMGPKNYLNAAIAEHLVRTKPEVAERLTKNYVKPYLREYMETQLGWFVKNRDLVRMDRERQGLDCSDGSLNHAQNDEYDGVLGAKFGLFYRFTFGNNAERIRNGGKILVLRDWEAKRFSAWPRDSEKKSAA